MVGVGEGTKVQPLCRLEGNRRWKSEMWLSNSADRNEGWKLSDVSYICCWYGLL